MTIAASCRFVASKYLIPAGQNTPALRIRGNGITVDFGGAVLEGTEPTFEPDQRVGTGLDIVGKNITIKNAVIRGYKVGLIARRAPGLKLINCDFSYNWKQHLRSTLEKEDESDWQSYHNNEHEEWLRYGAGAYLQDTDGFEIRGCKATGGPVWPYAHPLQRRESVEQRLLIYERSGPGDVPQQRQPGDEQQIRLVR